MARPKGTKYIESPEKMEIKRPDFEFELPYKKNSIGFYEVLPNRNHIGGKSALRELAKTKVKIGYVYLIQIKDTRKYKIGVSTKPKRRLSDISSILPYELMILAINQVDNPYSVEEHIMEKFKDKLIRNEWFDLDIKDARYIMIYLHNKQVEDSVIMQN